MENANCLYLESVGYLCILSNVLFVFFFLVSIYYRPSPNEAVQVNIKKEDYRQSTI